MTECILYRITLTRYNSLTMPRIFLTKLPLGQGQQALLTNNQDRPAITVLEIETHDIPLPDHPSLRLLEGYFSPEPLHEWVRALLVQTQPSDEILLAESEFLQASFARAEGRNVCTVPTPRDADSLPLLAPVPEALRPKARVLPYLLKTGQDLLDSAMPETQTHKPGVIVSWLVTLLESNQPTITADYIAIVDPETLTTPEEIEVGQAVLLTIALKLDAQTRLVDTVTLVRA
jgi:Pantoate-beta-alanine ligase